jgi:hypothetical protein
VRDLLPFVLQGALLGADEFWCHHRRHLGRWERIGHPVDTLSFVLCLGWLLLVEPGPIQLYVYVALAVISCLVVTKDEWEHQQHCDGFENWLHACLFMLHPTLLIWAGHLWWSGAESLGSAVGGAALMATVFMLYQITYWNWWRPRDQ